MFEIRRAPALASDDGVAEFRRARERSFERYRSRWPGALADPYDLLEPLTLDRASVLAIETAAAAIGAIYARVLPLLHNLSGETLDALGVRSDALELTRTRVPGFDVPLLARLDLAQTPNGVKLLEYNGEAPGLVVETFGLNALECADAGLRDVNAAAPDALATAVCAELQRAIESVGGPTERALAVFGYDVRSDRGRAAARYLAHLARTSLDVRVSDVPIESLSLADDRLRLQDGSPVTVLWRPCSIRYLGASLSGSQMPPHASANTVARLVRERRLALIDSPHTSLLSSKAAQAVIWGLVEQGLHFSEEEAALVETHFLPTTLDPPAADDPYVIKPAFGSEGDSIIIVDPGSGDVRCSAGTSFQDEPQVYQQYVSLPARHLMTEHGIRRLRLVTSCFLVAGRPRGIIIRAGDEITGEDAWVVPAGE